MFSDFELSLINQGLINNFRVIQRGPFKGWAMVPATKNKKDSTSFTIFSLDDEFKRDRFSFDVDIPNTELRRFAQIKNFTEMAIIDAALKTAVDSSLRYVSAKTADLTQKLYSGSTIEELDGSIQSRLREASFNSQTLSTDISKADFKQLYSMPMAFWSQPNCRKFFSDRFFDGLEQMRQKCDTVENLVALQACGVEAGNVVVSFMDEVMSTVQHNSDETHAYFNRISDFDAKCTKEINNISRAKA